MGGAGVADDTREVVDDRLGTRADRRCDSLDGPRVEAGDDHVVELARRDAGLLQRVVDRDLGERDVRVLTEPLLPDVRGVFARHTPSVEELVRRRAAAYALGERLRVEHRAREEECDSSVAAVALVGATRQTRTSVGQHCQDRGRRHAREALRCDRAAHGTDHVERRGVRGQTERGVDRGGVRLVEIRRRRRREHDGLGTDAARGPHRDAGGFDAHRRRVLVKRGDRAGALASSRSERRADRGSLQPVVRHVRAVGDDAWHWPPWCVLVTSSTGSRPRRDQSRLARG